MSRKNKVEVIKVEGPTPRSAVALAMQRRYGYGVKIFKDRRAPRGGAKRQDHHEGW